MNGITSSSAWRVVCKLLPTAVAVAGLLFLLGPIAVVIAQSVNGGQELTFPPRHFTLELYQQFLSDRAWWTPALQSLWVAFLTAILSLVVTLPAGYALSRTTFPGSKIIQLMMIAPMLIPVISLGLGIYIFFSRMHLDNSTVGLVLTHSTLVMPFMFISISAGMRQTNPALESVALLMGASRLRTFFQVVVPQLKPSICVGLLFAFLMSFDEVVIAYFITGPETTTLPVKMYSAIRWELSPVLTAISTILTLTSLGICIGILALREANPKV